MITQVRSWTHDDIIPNLIGRKKVDWSIFEYGSTIPNDFKVFFNQANNGKEIGIGSGESVTLFWNGQSYQASLRNVNQSSVERETLQLRYHSSEIKELMMTTFKSTYEYIQVRRPQDQGNSRVQVPVPDELAEYIEFYRTETPFVYEMKLIPLTAKREALPKIWWVNQGATLSEEKKEQVIWAPLSGKGGRSQYHWDTMDEVRQGDIVLNYANGYLQFVSRVLADVEHARKPKSMVNSAWEEEGRLVRLEYFPLHPKIPLINFAQDIMNLNINQGPIHSGAGVKQGYLFRFTVQGLNVIQSKSPEVEWPPFTILDSDEHVEERGMTLVEAISDNKVGETLIGAQKYIQQRGFSYPNHLIENFYLSLKTKPFVILAGVSGTGKTKLVKLFAEALGATSDNGQFTLIPVRPDWSDPSDLLGYKDLSGVFRPGRLTEVLVEASKPSNWHKPYFICLDEMNLARVEHYFSDLLSIIETQEWKDGRIVTNPLIHPANLQGDDKQLYGNLYLPDNVYVIGTVNMDETTHPFSKKVLDRANTIEFNYINLEQYPELEEDDAAPSVTPVPNDFLRSEYLQLVDVYSDETELVKRTTEKLVKVNTILEQIHSHVGFRIRDAVCFYLAYNKRFELLSEDDAFDLQLLQKILPRVQGSSASVKRALLQLLEVATGKTIRADQYLDDASGIYEKWSSNSPTQTAKHPNSTRKIAFMLRRLEEDGFTSYWLS